MQCLLFVATLLCLTVVTRSQDVVSTMRKVKAGIDATKAITDFLGNEQFSESFKKIGTLAAYTGPFLGAIGPIIALVSTFLPVAPNEQMRLLKKEFAKVDKNFNEVFRDIAEVKDLIKETALKDQYSAYELTIEHLSLKLQEYLAGDTAVVADLKQNFISAFNRSYDGAASKLWTGMVDTDLVLASNIPLTAMDFYHNDRKKVQRIMKGVFNLILQGIKVELAYWKAMGLDSQYAVQRDLWDNKTKQLLYKMEIVDLTVTFMWYGQMKREIPKKLEDWQGDSHSDFAKKLYDFLKGKYDWREFHVIAYNELHGGTHHWVKFCAGHHSFRQYGRNLVIASVFTGMPSISTDYAKFKLNAVSVRELKTGPWGIRKWWAHRRAQDIFEKKFPDSIRSGCRYASAGVIEKDADVAHVASPGRLALSNRGHYILHAFG